MPISVLSKHDFRLRRADAAAEALARKVPVAADVFKQLSPPAKARAFTLATVHKARVLQKARNMVAAAIRNGTPTKDLMRALLAAFDTAGIDRPSVGRLRQAVRGNMLAAYSTARREQMDQPHIVAAFPLRQYLTVGNGQPGINSVRDTHAKLHGKVFVHNDPFWDRFTPPWEYGCRCFYRALSAKQVKTMRAIVWTYRGGAVVPAPVRKDGVGRQPAPVPGRTRGFRLQANPNFAVDAVELDLSKIDAELRRAVEETLKGV